MMRKLAHVGYSNGRRQVIGAGRHGCLHSILEVTKVPDGDDRQITTKEIR
jgi:hypothetical protein